MLSRGGTGGQVRLGATNRAWQRDLRHMEASSGPRRRADRGHHSALGPAEQARRAGLCAFTCPPVSGRSQAGEALRTSLVAQMVSIGLQCRRPGFSAWIRKIPWRRKWQSTPVFLSGESHGWRSLVDYSPQRHKVSRHG